MNDAARAAREILKQYAKHGWTLRRVLLCQPTRANLAPPLEDLFGDAEVISSEIDALWFSRAANDGSGEAWEIRRLSGSPFALVDVFNASDDEAARERRRREMESKLKAKR